MVENVLINGSCHESVIHPGLFEIIFTSLTLPIAQRQYRLPIPLVTFEESTGWGSQIQMMLERSQLSERSTEASASSQSLLLNRYQSISSKAQYFLLGNGGGDPTPPQKQSPIS